MATKEFEMSTMKHLEEITKDLNTSIKSDPHYIVITEEMLFEQLGQLQRGRDDWGWGNGKGFHKLTIREMNPDGCPCCGRPWEGSE